MKLTPEELFTTFTRTITETQKAAQLTEENIPKLATLFKCTVDYSTGKPRLIPQGHPLGYGIGDHIGYMRTKHSDQHERHQPRRRLDKPMTSLETASPYATYWWDCPYCGDTNDARDIEPSGTQTCETCHQKVMME